LKVDLCALTEDVLPLYADDLLSPATRQLLEQHAAVCPACRQLLQEAAAAPVPSPPPVQLRMERPARAFFGRLSRMLFTGLAAVVALLIVTSSLSYVLGRRSTSDRMMIPARAASADEVALRAVPGWERAVAQGLVVDIGVTERIPRTDATVTVEKAWYSGRKVYVLYTVTAPEGGYWLPIEASLRGDDPEQPYSHGGTNWNHLSTWGGFSPEGFHAILTFGGVPQVNDSLELVLRQWMRVSPESGPTRIGAGATFWEDLRIPLPWDTAYLAEPDPDIIPWPQRHTWLGRTLALDALSVGIGRAQLTGEITVPEGERDPVLQATLIVGDQELDWGSYAAEPIGESGRYRFTLTFDGPNQWPAPVRLRLEGIAFATDHVLEWPVHWAKYREMTGAERRLMDPEDQVTLQFYDSQLTSIFTTYSGVSIEQRDPERTPPYVRASISMGGRGFPDDLGPGFEVENDAGEVLTNLGGGAGVIYDGPGRHDERQGVAVMWWDDLPDSFRQSERLLIRYVEPSAALVLDETWTLPTEN